MSSTPNPQLHLTSITTNNESNLGTTVCWRCIYTPPRRRQGPDSFGEVKNVGPSLRFRFLFFVRFRLFLQFFEKQPTAHTGILQKIKNACFAGETGIPPASPESLYFSPDPLLEIHIFFSDISTTAAGVPSYRSTNHEIFHAWVEIPEVTCGRNTRSPMAICNLLARLFSYWEWLPTYVR